MSELVYDHVVVRYGELSTKGKNRKEFTRQLTQNIRKRLQDYPQLTYNMLHDGLFIKLNGEDYETIRKDLKDVFGYSYFAGAVRTEKDLDAVKKGIQKALEIPVGRRPDSIKALLLATPETEMGLYSLLTCTAIGATIVLPQDDRIQTVSNTARNHDVTHVIAFPLTLSALMKRTQKRL